MKLALTCVAALAAAVLFAFSAVLQQRVARKAPEEESLRLKLLLDLLRQPAWLAGGGAMLVAYVLQAVALALGRVALVEPLIVTELVVAVPLATRTRKLRPGRREWSGVLLVVGGVATFLASSDPRGGTSEPDVLHWLIALPSCGAVVGVLLFFARGPRSPRRATLLAAASGVCFGVLSLVTKSAVGLLGQGLLTLLTSWQPELLCVLGIGGFLIAQSAYQAAPLASSLPVIDSGEPTVAVLLAALVLAERLQDGPVHLAFEAAGALASLAGIFLLGRSPLVLRLYERQAGERQAGDGDPEEAAPPPSGPSLSTGAPLAGQDPGVA